MKLLLMESPYVKVAEKAEILIGKMKAVNVGGKDILIVNANGNYYAIGQHCGHAGGDLSQGVLEGTVVTCPRHHAKYDVTTGKVISPPTIGFLHPKAKDEPIYQVKIDNENIMVKP
jgi:nitrite reductase/ring-hydroxylating ferredoxin subunit